jgi:pilus assembly protein CpaE
MAAGNKIRVIIVDDVQETRENIRRLLQFEPEIEVVGVAGNGRDGIDVTKQTRPDVVLMDINMPDMDGIAATEAIRRTVPFTQIVILSVQNDPNYMRRAMLAGARDFLTKPPAVDELTAAIRRAGKMANEERSKASSAGGPPGTGSSSSGARATQGRMITVYSPKGGAGTTTVAVNLAMALHNEETPTILVDGDLQFGDVAVVLNMQGKNSLADLTQRADELDFDVVNEVAITHPGTGLKILAAPPRPEYAEQVSGEQFIKVVNFLRRMFTYVIVDTSTYLTDTTLAAIEGSDMVVLLVTQDIPAIKNARLFMNLVRDLKVSPRRILFTMNRFDRRIGITPEKISESFKHEIAVVIPYDDRVVIPSINRGMPFIISDKSKPVSRAVLSLAELVRQRGAELMAEEVQQAR